MTGFWFLVDQLFHPVLKWRYDCKDPLIFSDFKQQRREQQRKTHLGNGGYFVIFASSSHPLLLTEQDVNGLVEAQLKQI